MDSNVTQLSASDRLLAWFDLHQKQVLWGTIAVLAAGLIVAVVIARQKQTKVAANTALSKAIGHGMTERLVTPEALLQIAEKYPNSAAAERALLLAAADLYKKGNYAEAQAQFEKFVREYRSSSFVNQAFLGIAASLDAQGKTDEAAAAYEAIVGRRLNDNTTPQAQFALARIYESRNDLKNALAAYAAVRQTLQGGHLGDEAGMRYQELITKHPELAATPAPQPQAMPQLQSQPAPQSQPPVQIETNQNR